eukprot:jgi/Mesen1/8268/ME000448S07416
MFKLPAESRCIYFQNNCLNEPRSFQIDYSKLHFCTLGGRAWLSVPLLVVGVLAAFYLLADTAEQYFCPVVALMSDLLNLPPNTAGVTLLAFGNGAPDVFASLAAFVGGNPKVGFGAIVSAGGFVTAFVVGCVAAVAAPFAVHRRPFLRDILFYLVAAVCVFLIYCSGVVYLWQSVGLILYYVVFVITTVVTDRRHRHERSSASSCSDRDLPPTTPMGGPTSPEPACDGDGRDALSSSLKTPRDREPKREPRREPRWEPEGGPKREPKGLWQQPTKLASSPFPFHDSDRPAAATEDGPTDEEAPAVARTGSGIKHLGVLWRQWQLPFDLLRAATIPSISESAHSHLRTSANVLFAPLLLLYSCRSAIPVHARVPVLFSPLELPIWAVLSAEASVLAAAYYLAAPRQFLPELLPATAAAAFAMSIVWISTLASELLGLLLTLGKLLHLSPAILGLTVLAWGNSVGDLVADVTIARKGQPAMAVAGCFAGPMFNMLIGLGSALTISTARSYPEGLRLHYHPNVPFAFSFLFLSLIGSLVVVAGSKFKVSRRWGLCLIGMYIAFISLSVFMESGLVIDLPPHK